MGKATICYFSKKNWIYQKLNWYSKLQFHDFTELDL